MTITTPLYKRFGCTACGSTKLKEAEESNGAQYLECESCGHVFEAIKPLSDEELMALVAQHVADMPKGTVLSPTLLELKMRTVDSGVILWCYRDKAPYPMVTRYCTHQMTLHHDGEMWWVSMHHGHYDMDIHDAAEDYTERCQGKWA